AGGGGGGAGGVVEHRGGSPRREAHHHDGEGAPAEDHEIERIHQHQGGGSDRRDPGLGGEPQQMVAVEQDPARNAEDGHQDAGGESFAGGEQEALEHVLLDDHARKSGDDVGGARHDEAVDHGDANEEFDKRDERNKRTEAERGRKVSALGKRRGGGHRFSPSCNFLLSSSSKPRLASSRRSLQICAT